MDTLHSLIVRRSQELGGLETHMNEFFLSATAASTFGTSFVIDRARVLVRRCPGDPPQAHWVGEVAGVVHPATDRVTALRHLGHPLELPLEQDTCSADLLGHQLVHHRCNA